MTLPTTDQYPIFLVFVKYLKELLQGYSIEHDILQLTDQINDNFENNCLALGVAIDLSKAFDTINHQILISKLENYRVKGNRLS